MASRARAAAEPAEAKAARRTGEGSEAKKASARGKGEDAAAGKAEGVTKSGAKKTARKPRAAKSDQAPVEAVANPSPAASAGSQPVLNPATAWPFPTGNRPR